MKRQAYLAIPEVKDFILWIGKRLDAAHSFGHSYKMKKPAIVWHCDSLYSAFENYTWPFRCKHPLSNTIMQGSSYQDSLEVLKMLSNGLQQSINDSDNELCREFCFSILEWGGVLNYNDKRILKLGNNVCQYFRETRQRFQCDLSYDQYYDKRLVMNSGFTKLYSLSMSDFIIYDGRVGAALGLLVRLYCQEMHLDKIPDVLAFAWGKGKESSSTAIGRNRRDPSDSRYVFPQLSNNPRRHTENNIKANWLLRGILNQTISRFSALEPEIQMRAMEAALFMIGYSVNTTRSLMIE